MPRHVRVIESWPMSATKIQKFRLAERIAQELETATVPSAPSTTR